MEFTEAERNFIAMAMLHEAEEGLASFQIGIMPAEVFRNGIALIGSIANKLQMEENEQN